MRDARGPAHRGTPRAPDPELPTTAPGGRLEQGVRAGEGGPDDLVELVAEDGTPVGTAPRVSVHTADTPLHRAFSLYLFNDRGQVLMTRRALGKRTWPGVWTNACCGHPRPGEPTPAAIRRRVGEELGARLGSERVALPDFAYRAADASGVVEHELCPVHVGRLADDHLDPDPAEVMDHRWLDFDDVVAGVRATPEVFSPWAARQVTELAASGTVEALRRGRAGAAAAPAEASTLAAVDRLLADEAAGLRRRWADSIPPGPVDVLGDDLTDVLDDLVRHGGKRIRPMMCHWGFVAAGGTGEEAYADLVRIAAALELLHLFALIHDDVMDGSETRRGRPAAHVRAREAHRTAGAHGDADEFGRNVAILLGDLAHAEADRLVSTLPAGLRRAWFAMCVELIAGQRADLTGAAARRLDLDHARLMARLKSGAYTIERPLLFGGDAARGDAGALATLAAYGREIGEAFALRDDVLGVWGDPAATGKPAGDDLRSGKATVILALARPRLAGVGRRALERVGTPQAGAEDVAVLQEALVEAGVRDEVETMITEAHARAIAALASGELTPAGVVGLRSAADRITWRDR